MTTLASLFSRAESLKDVVITDVTRMAAGRVCIAGALGKRLVRLHEPQPMDKWLQSIGGLVAGEVVSFDWRAVKRYRPPHSEDGDWVPQSLTKTGTLGAQEFASLLSRDATAAVESAFGKPLFFTAKGNPAFRPDRGKRSLATLRASSVRLYRHREGIRADFTDLRQDWTMVPVEDLRLRKLMDDPGDDQADIDDILGELSRGAALLRVGLGRPFQGGDQPAGCFLQVNLVKPEASA